VEDGAIQRSAIARVGLAVSVVVAIADIALAVTVRVGHVIGGHAGTVVVPIVHTVVVRVGNAVKGTTHRILQVLCDTDLVTTAGEAICGAVLVGLAEATGIVTARAAIDGADLGALIRTAQSVAAGQEAVESTRLFILGGSAEAVTALCAVLGAIQGRFADVADPIAAWGEAICGAIVRVLCELTLAVAALWRAVAGTGHVVLGQGAESVAAVTAVRGTTHVCLVALALTVTAHLQAVERAFAAVGPLFMQTADSVAAGTAIHRAPDCRLFLAAQAVTADVAADSVATALRGTALAAIAAAAIIPALESIARLAAIRRAVTLALARLALTVATLFHRALAAVGRATGAVFVLSALSVAAAGPTILGAERAVLAVTALAVAAALAAVKGTALAVLVHFAFAVAAQTDALAISAPARAGALTATAAALVRAAFIPFALRHTLALALHAVPGRQFRAPVVIVRGGDTACLRVACVVGTEVLVIALVVMRLYLAAISPHADLGGAIEVVETQFAFIHLVVAIVVEAITDLCKEM